MPERAGACAWVCVRLRVASSGSCVCALLSVGTLSGTLSLTLSLSRVWWMVCVVACFLLVSVRACFLSLASLSLSLGSSMRHCLMPHPSSRRQFLSPHSDILNTKSAVSLVGVGL